MLGRPAPDAGEAGVGERVRQAVGADVATSAHGLRCPGRLTLAGAKQVRVGLRAQGGLDPRRGCDSESHEATAFVMRSACSRTPNRCRIAAAVCCGTTPLPRALSASLRVMLGTAVTQPSGRPMSHSTNAGES